MSHRKAVNIWTLALLALALLGLSHAFDAVKRIIGINAPARSEGVPFK